MPQLLEYEPNLVSVPEHRAVNTNGGVEVWLHVFLTSVPDAQTCCYKAMKPSGIPYFIRFVQQAVRVVNKQAKPGLRFESSLGVNTKRADGQLRVTVVHFGSKFDR
jgi:hypothetical protein